MKQYLFALLLVLFISCSSEGDKGLINDNENQEVSASLVGTWQYIQRGLIYESGVEEVIDTECSNSYIFRFFEGGTFEVEIWWIEDGVCTFDQIRDGNYLKISNPDYPEANYRLRFFEIPDDDEEIGYANISFQGDTRMRIQYAEENPSSNGILYIFSDYNRQ